MFTLIKIWILTNASTQYVTNFPKNRFIAINKTLFTDTRTYYLIQFYYQTCPNVRQCCLDEDVKPIKIYAGCSDCKNRAARVTLNVGLLREERTVTLFNKLNWILFYDETNINQCWILYKCLQGIALEYLVNRLARLATFHPGVHYTREDFATPEKLRVEKHLYPLLVNYGTLHQSILGEVGIWNPLKENFLIIKKAKIQTLIILVFLNLVHEHILYHIVCNNFLF